MDYKSWLHVDERVEVKVSSEVIFHYFHSRHNFFISKLVHFQRSVEFEIGTKVKLYALGNIRPKFVQRVVR